MNLDETIAQIEARIGSWFAPASESHLRALEAMGAPHGTVDFYARLEPNDVNIFGVWHFSIASLRRYASEISPYREMLEKRLVTFAIEEGAALVFDLEKVSARGEAHIVRVRRDANFEGLRRNPEAMDRRFTSLTHYWESVLQCVVEAEEAGWFRKFPR